MSGAFSDIKRLRSQLKETEERLKPPVPASPPRLGKYALEPDAYLRAIQKETELLDHELARTGLKMEDKQPTYQGKTHSIEGRRHLQMIRKDMAELDQELGSKLNSRDEDDDLCVSSPSEPDQSVLNSPFHSHSNSFGSPRDLPPMMYESDAVRKERDRSAAVQRHVDERVASLERRLQGANASVRALEKALKDKDYRIKELEEELQFKARVLDGLQSQSYPSSSQLKSGQQTQATASQLRRREKELEK